MIDAKPFTPHKLDLSKCLARTWGGGRGGQCRLVPIEGDQFCCTHHTNEKWKVHGRVDGDIPEEKLLEFQRAGAAPPPKVLSSTSPKSIASKASKARPSASPTMVAASKSTAASGKSANAASLAAGILAPKPFTPREIDFSKCLARTWDAGNGGQCSRSAPEGKLLCNCHSTDDKWKVHGRVDQEVPREKLLDFQKAQGSIQGDSMKRLRDDSSLKRPAAASPAAKSVKQKTKTFLKRPAAVGTVAKSLSHQERPAAD